MKGKRTTVDMDKMKVYSAEFRVREQWDTPAIMVELHGVTLSVPEERKFARVEDVQRFVDAVLAHVACDRPIKVRKRRGVTKAHYEMGGVIAVPDAQWALREIVVLHEIAHHLAPGCGHNGVFRARFVELVEAVMGHEARFFLQTAFWDQGLTA